MTERCSTPECRDDITKKLADIKFENFRNTSQTKQLKWVIGIVGGILSLVIPLSVVILSSLGDKMISRMASFEDQLGNYQSQLLASVTLYHGLERETMMRLDETNRVVLENKKDIEVLKEKIR